MAELNSGKKRIWVAVGIVVLSILGVLFPRIKPQIDEILGSGPDVGGRVDIAIAFERGSGKTVVVGRCGQQPDSPITLVVREVGEKTRCQIVDYVLVEPSGQFRYEVPTRYLKVRCEVYVLPGKRMPYDQSIEVPGSNVLQFDPAGSE